jgi:PPK2 family polyphosphate:nucleotide phosphotransferase
MASSVAAEAVDRLDARRRRLTGTWSLMTEHWQIAEGASVDLSEIDPHTCEAAPGGKRETRAASDRLRRELRDLQKRLYAEDSRAVLVVLQAMDAGGKDGAIRKAFSGLNPQGCRVHTFNKPTEEELAHDFLWRIHPRCPRKGTIGIFNRSHYEDVVAVRVRHLVPEEVWRARYDAIRDFERILASEGTRIVKLFLHISQEEQARRLRKRLENPTKQWKFKKGDLDDRDLWPEFMRAYADAIGRTSTADAPWYVIPADRKWYRDWAVLTVVLETLREMDPRYPAPEEDLSDVVVV